MKRKAPIPQYHFTSYDEMLIYHDGHDVFVDEGLQKWKHYVLDAVCGVAPKPSRGTKIISMKKSIREELQAAQNDSEIAQISADVSVTDFILV